MVPSAVSATFSKHLSHLSHFVSCHSLSFALRPLRSSTPRYPILSHLLSTPSFQSAPAISEGTQQEHVNWSCIQFGLIWPYKLPHFHVVINGYGKKLWIAVIGRYTVCVWVHHKFSPFQYVSVSLDQWSYPPCWHGTCFENHLHRLDWVNRERKREIEDRTAGRREMGLVELIKPQHQ